MTDRPILFSAPMICALLAGTKTQTRRIIKPRHNPNRPSLFDGSWSDSYVLDPGNQKWRDDAYPWRVGDRLWVREAWRAEAICDNEPPRNLQEDACQIFYPADGSWSDRDDMTAAGKLRPSMFMPRWASRLTLIVTGVKVERLQDISEEDAIAEGIASCEPTSLADWCTSKEAMLDAPVGAYALLWDRINGSGAWEANPWVVALTFTVHKQNIDAMKETA